MFPRLKGQRDALKAARLMITGGDCLAPSTRLERRSAALRDYLTQQYGLDEVSVRLSQSGQHYTIHLPSKDAVGRMFAEASENPQLAKPFWTRVWASGVAMADMALARKSERRARECLS